MPNLKAIKDIIAGDAVCIGDRSIVPIVQIMAIYTSGGELAGAMISPLALVITDCLGEYFVDLTGQGLTIDNLMETSPGLDEAIKRARDGHL